MKKWLWLFAMGIVLTGCVTVWSKVEQASFTAEDHSYTVALPVGWVRHLMGHSPNDVFITYDGPGLDRIEIVKHANKDAFPKIKKSASENMLAYELAELMIAELKSNKDLANLEVVENVPATISGTPGFKLELRVKNSKGVEFELLIYGVATKSGFYTLTYAAPRMHYYDKYKGVFESTVASFRLL